MRNREIIDDADHLVLHEAQSLGTTRARFVGAQQLLDRGARLGLDGLQDLKNLTAHGGIAGVLPVCHQRIETVAEIIRIEQQFLALGRIHRGHVSAYRSQPPYPKLPRSRSRDLA